MNDTNTATVRTAWNGTIVSAIIIATAKAFGWDIQLEDLGPFLPVITFAIIIVYRTSLVVGEKWPWVGLILFGKSTTPSYEPLPPPEWNPDRGSTSVQVLFPVLLAVGIIGFFALLLL